MFRAVFISGGKLVFQLMLWVFVLSISWNGRTLYDRVYEVLLENQIIQVVDEKVEDVWEFAKDKVKVALSNSKNVEEHME